MDNRSRRSPPPLVRWSHAIGLALALVFASLYPTPTATADGRGRPALVRRRPTGTAPSTVITDVHYDGMKRAALATLRKFPLRGLDGSGRRPFYLTIGRSPVGLTAFLKELSQTAEPTAGDMTDIVSSIPAGGLKQAIDAANFPEYFRHFDKYLPRDVKQGRRDVVLIDWVLGGGSVKNFATALNAYWKHKGVTTGSIVYSGFEGQESGQTTYNADHTGFDFVGKKKDFPGALEMDGNGRGEYTTSHPINLTNGRLEDLVPNPNHVPFRQALRWRMDHDDELGEILTTEFAEHVRKVRKLDAGAKRASQPTP